MSQREQSARSKVVERRTYQRPLDADGTVFETTEQAVDRILNHQQWLWERAKGEPLNQQEKHELSKLGRLHKDRSASVSGRTRWLGGTRVAQTREASQFNCSFEKIATIHDVVDAFWLLLQGCGVGGKAEAGILNGFAKPVEIKTLKACITREEWDAGIRGEEENLDYTYIDHSGSRVWKLSIGDSAEAWSKSVGKLLAMKDPVDQILLDFGDIRPAGIRLSGYGWISSGDVTFRPAMVAIAEILNRRAGQLLTKEDINDIINWLGTTLSSRRSAEILLCDSDEPDAQQFALRKKSYWEGNPQREQSNNSLVFWQRPSRLELRGIFDLIEEGGGSEPGFINGEQARMRAPWFQGVNPCAEILLGNKNFCNLVEVNLQAFNGRYEALLDAMYLMGRANYRQTCVDLKDGILQDTWHELNQFLRLTGVGITGITGWEDANCPECFQEIAAKAREGAHSMADELGLPRSKLVTTIKPSGTLSKLMDTTEGAHKPLGRYIFNWITLSNHDPLIGILQEAGYDMMAKPFSEDSTLVCMPVAYEDVPFDEVERDGETLYVNLESAVDQLERYKLLMENYVDHNCSITVSYSPDEVPDIVNWIYDNWDSYVGVSFIYRNDPTKTAADLGYPYLPQEVVTKSRYDEYVSRLKSFDLDKATGFAELEDDECASGMCPVR